MSNEVNINFCPACGDRVSSTENLCHKCSYDLNDYRNAIAKTLPTTPAPENNSPPENAAPPKNFFSDKKKYIAGVAAVGAMVWLSGTFILTPSKEPVTPAKPVTVQEPVQIEEPAQVVDAHWIKDTNTDIYLWNPEPSDGESIKWVGGFVQDGKYKFAEGPGNVLWYRDGNLIQMDEGTFEHGRHHGQFKHTFASGRIDYSNWSHGVETNTAADEARTTFIEYHQAITDRDYSRAYSMLASEQKQHVGDFNSYAAGYSNTLESAITDISAVSASDESVTFNYQLTARDSIAGDKVKIQIFEGQVTLVKLDGRWYIYNAKSRKVDEIIP